MIRTIIKIDEELCNGCGLCVQACHEGAIALIDGKAKLIRDDYCDGLGNCLPVCPTGAIAFEKREAAAYDEAAVEAAQAKKAEHAQKTPQHKPFTGCPGTMAKAIARKEEPARAAVEESTPSVSQLAQWPVQIKLVPINAPYFKNAHLLVSADCAAYAYANFHKDFMKNHVTIIGCPKLDEGDYAEKLTEIIARNDIKSVKVVRMEVPCCGGIEYAVKQALQKSGKFIPWSVVTISTDGQVLED